MFWTNGCMWQNVEYCKLRTTTAMASVTANGDGATRTTKAARGGGGVGIQIRNINNNKAFNGHMTVTVTIMVMICGRWGAHFTIYPTLPQFHMPCPTPNMHNMTFSHCCRFMHRFYERQKQKTCLCGERKLIPSIFVQYRWLEWNWIFFAKRRHVHVIVQLAIAHECTSGAAN